MMGTHLKIRLPVQLICCAALMGFLIALPAAAKDGPDSALVVLGDDKGIRSCVERALKKAIKKSAAPVRLAESDDPSDPIRTAFYPWLEVDERTEVVETLSFLSENQIALDTRRISGLRYLVFTLGRTVTDEKQGDIGIAPGGFFVGYARWDKTTDIGAVLLDLDNPELEHILDAYRTGTTRIPAFVLPIPIPASTQAPACRDLADKIAEQVSNIESAEPADSTR